MTSQRRKIRDATDADQCLAALTRSGLTLRAWSRAHGVDGRSLHAWRLARTRLDVPAPLRWVEVVTAPVVAEPFRIHVQELVVDVPPTFDAASLHRLLVVLRC